MSFRRASTALYLVLAALIVQCGDGGDTTGPIAGGGSGTETVGIMGVFVDPDGKAVAGARVRLLDTTQQTHYDSDTTDSDGAYLFDSLEARAYKLDALLGDSVLISRLAVRTADTLTYRYERTGAESLLVLVDSPYTVPAAYVRTDTMYEPGAIRGTVNLSGVLLGIQVFIPGTSYSATTDDDGAYLMTGVAPGTYRLAAMRAGYQTVTIAGITVLAGDTTAASPIALVIDPALAPPAPQSVQSTYDTATGTVLLTWSSVPVSDLAGYEIYCDTNSGPRHLIGSTQVGDTTFEYGAYLSLTDTRSRDVHILVRAVDTDSNRSLYSPVHELYLPSPTTVRTFVTFYPPDTVYLNQPARVGATCTNAGRLITCLTWAIRRTSGSLDTLRVSPSSGARTITDFASITFDTSGTYRVVLLTTDNAGDIWSDSVLLSVGGEFIPQDTTIAGPQLRVARRTHCAAVLGNKLVISGGQYDRIDAVTFKRQTTALASVEMLVSPSSTQWQTCRSLGTPRFAHTMVSLGDTLYVLGGTNTDDPFRVELLDTLDSTWHELAWQIPEVRHGAAAVGFGGAIYVFGGVTFSANPLAGNIISNEINRFDPATGAWIKVGTMSAHRAHHRVVVLNGMAYVVGGYGGADSTEVAARCLSSVESFTFTTMQSTTRAALPQARMLAGAATINNRLYVLGGTSSSSLSQIHQSVVSWTPGETGWRTEGPLPLACHSMGACTYGNAIAVTGGSSSAVSDAQGESSSVLFYYP